MYEARQYTSVHTLNVYVPIFYSYHRVLTLVSLVLHPYYKRQYFELRWGGTDDPRAASDAEERDPNDINWAQYAREVVETAVSWSFTLTHPLLIVAA